MRVTCVGARNERARSVSKSGDLNKCKNKRGKVVTGDYGEIYYNLDEKVQKKRVPKTKDERGNLKKKREILSFLRQYKFTLFFFSLVFFCGR